MTPGHTNLGPEEPSEPGKGPFDTRIARRRPGDDAREFGDGKGRNRRKSIGAEIVQSYHRPQNPVTDSRAASPRKGGAIRPEGRSDHEAEPELRHVSCAQDPFQ